MVYGSLKVIPVDTETYATFVVRTFCMKFQVSIIKLHCTLGNILQNSMKST